MVDVFARIIRGMMKIKFVGGDCTKLLRELTEADGRTDTYCRYQPCYKSHLYRHKYLGCKQP